MINMYDLYDLSAIFKNIRMYPNYELNYEILKKIKSVLLSQDSIHDLNQFRSALSTIQNLDKEMYSFAYVQNEYVYFSSFLKKENIYNLLIKVCEELMLAITEKNVNKVVDLADCLHNLPIFLVENNFSVPKDYWKNEVKYFRDKWDKKFLLAEQKSNR